MMDETLRSLVKQRANHRCEYCHMPQEYDVLPFQIDHIISLKHHGSSEAENLALACFNCNSYKGPNIAGIDIKSGNVTPLFHPRRNPWKEHFRWEGPYLDGCTAIGETTIDVLSINLPERVELRRTLMMIGVSFEDEISED
jgi:HNH endonuclease